MGHDASSTSWKKSLEESSGLHVSTCVNALRRWACAFLLTVVHVVRIVDAYLATNVCDDDVLQFVEWQRFFGSLDSATAREVTSLWRTKSMELLDSAGRWTHANGGASGHRCYPP